MKPGSLFELGVYSLKWIKDFYQQAGVWWGADPQMPSVHKTRVETVERLCGAGQKRFWIWARVPARRLPLSLTRVTM